jgi:hypothetical protein
VVAEAEDLTTLKVGFLVKVELVAAETLGQDLLQTELQTQAVVEQVLQDQQVKKVWVEVELLL